MVGLGRSESERGYCGGLCRGNTQFWLQAHHLMEVARPAIIYIHLKADTRVIAAVCGMETKEPVLVF